MVIVYFGGKIWLTLVFEKEKNQKFYLKGFRLKCRGLEFYASFVIEDFFVPKVNKNVLIDNEVFED